MCQCSRLGPDYLSPVQLAVGVSSGCEAAVHSARRFVEDLPSDHVVVKLDFSNAFNSLDRSEMLQAVADRLPELYAFCHSAYTVSHLSCFSDSIAFHQK